MRDQDLPGGGATDLRKGFEGLYGMVKDRLGLEPLSGHLVFFCNGSRNPIKVLFWDGYVMFAIMGRRDSGGAIFQGTTKIAIPIILAP